MPQRLRFEGPLYVSGTPPSEVRAHLVTMHKELAGLDQGSIDTSELDAYCRELIRPALLRHKDLGVQSIVACILADVLRLYAPNAPFSPSEIKVRYTRLPRRSSVSCCRSWWRPLPASLTLSMLCTRTPCMCWKVSVRSRVSCSYVTCPRATTL